MTEYQQSAERCIEIVAGKVCGGCGGVLTPIETVDNANRPTFWPGCESCNRFDYGVTPEVFRIARALVEEGTVTPYTYNDMQKYRDSKNEDERRYWVTAQTHGAVSIVQHVLTLSADAAKLAKVRELIENAAPHWYCNKCGWFGDTGAEHSGCDYFAADVRSVRVAELTAILQGDSHE